MKKEKKDLTQANTAVKSGSLTVEYQEKYLQVL